MPPQHLDSASRMSAESSSESEAQSVSGKSNNNNGKDSKDKKRGMFRFLPMKKRSSQQPQ